MERFKKLVWWSFVAAVFLMALGAMQDAKAEDDIRTPQDMLRILLAGQSAMCGTFDGVFFVHPEGLRVYAHGFNGAPDSIIVLDTNGNRRIIDQGSWRTMKCGAIEHDRSAE